MFVIMFLFLCRCNLSCSKSALRGQFGRARWTARAPRSPGLLPPRQRADGQGAPGALRARALRGPPLHRLPDARQIRIELRPSVTARFADWRCCGVAAVLPLRSPVRSCWQARGHVAGECRAARARAHGGRCSAGRPSKPDHRGYDRCTMTPAQPLNMISEAWGVCI